MNIPQRPVIPQRRKSTLSKRRAADSSELSPSPHSSIFEAYRISPGTSEENERSVAERKTERRATRSTPEEELPFRYGRGTMLETIIEKKSNMTLSTLARTRSTDDLSSLMNMQQQRDVARLRRKQSFSVDDLILVNRSYNATGTAPTASDAAEIYAQPKMPLQAPPDRPSTPPGMPSWTAAQVLRTRAAPDIPQRLSSRLQRFFGVQEVQRQARPPMQRGPDGRRIPRYRPPSSVYGNIDDHPFTTAMMAKPQQPIGLPRPTGLRRPGQNLHTTPIAGDSSELLSFRTAPESRRASVRLSASSGKQCPHLKERLAHLRQTLEPQDSTSVLPSQASSSTRRRVVITNGNTPCASADQLISGTLPVHESTGKCWRCRLDTVTDRVDQYWLGSAMLLCYVCCGVEFDEEDATENPRRVLEHTPTVAS
ncbi:hypothetical protein PVAG01_00240 [Phlyctema vagabunda]|uniref:Uncharacterized protein n=1 Tax=Phlyctema vagabunda TaxID=108571 RepID=A0ABR4PTZ8_9HELO